MTGQPDREKNMDKTREDTGNTRQRILVFQQNGSGEKKIKGINEFGAGEFDLEVISIDQPLPTIIDETGEYLPKEIEADLVLDYLKHPDLSHDLALMCQERNIPLVASGKKIRVRWALTPPTCCGLARQAGLGRYGERFGAPEFEVEVEDGKIAGVKVVRGAPCGASWPAVQRLIGLPVEEAAVRLGLETQYFCVADPSGWDPLFGKSPVHFAGHVHKAALERALLPKSKDKD